MNSLLLNITEQLKNNLKVKNAKTDYIINEVNTYYDLEGFLRIAIKIFDNVEEKERTIILGGVYLEDCTESEELK